MDAIIAGTGGSLSKPLSWWADKPETRIAVNGACLFVPAYTHCCVVDRKPWMQGRVWLDMARASLLTTQYAYDNITGLGEEIQEYVIAPRAAYGTEVATLWLIEQGYTSIQYIGCDADGSRHSGLCSDYSHRKETGDEYTYDNSYVLARCLNHCVDGGVAYRVLE